MAHLEGNVEGARERAKQFTPGAVVPQAKSLDPAPLITHHFTLDRILDAYDTFGRAAETQALKVIISP